MIGWLAWVFRRQDHARRHPPDAPAPRVMDHGDPVFDAIQANTALGLAAQRGEQLRDRTTNEVVNPFARVLLREEGVPDEPGGD